MRDIVRSRVAAAIAATLLAGAPALAQDETLPELINEGRPLYADQCSACHGNNGQGTGIAPALDGNANVEGRTFIVNQILWGDSEHGMPAFVDMLTDREVAAIATYVRNSWKNSYGIIFPRSVELRRP